MPRIPVRKSTRPASPSLERRRSPRKPIGRIGMQRFANGARKKAPALWAKVSHVLAPNAEPPGSIQRSAARAHGGFDDDMPTLVSTLARMLEVKKLEAAMEMTGSGPELRVRRGRWRRCRGQP